MLGAVQDVMLPHRLFLIYYAYLPFCLRAGMLSISLLYFCVFFALTFFRLHQKNFQSNHLEKIQKWIKI